MPIRQNYRGEEASEIRSDQGAARSLPQAIEADLSHHGGRDFDLATKYVYVCLMYMHMYV